MTLAVGALIALVAALTTGIISSTQVPVASPRLQPEDIALASTSAPELAPASAPRAVYAYSVINGGARSRQELTDAISRDAVVAAHYRSVSIGAMRPERVEEDRLVYMSYRMGDNIYWTKHKVRLKQGETILTDGVTQIRSRCGNCIALQPMTPTSDSEPEAVQLDALVDAGTDVAPSTPSDIAFGTAPFVSNDVTVEPDGSLSLVPFGSGPGDVPSFAGGIIPTNPETDFRGSDSVGGSTSLATEIGSSTPPPFPPITLPTPEGAPDVPGGSPDSPFGGSTTDTVPNSESPSGGPTTDIVPSPFVTTTPEDAPFPPVPPGEGGFETPPPLESTPVPEPGTLLLVGGGLATFLSRRNARRRQRDNPGVADVRRTR